MGRTSVDDTALVNVLHGLEDDADEVGGIPVAPFINSAISWAQTNMGTHAS